MIASQTFAHLLGGFEDVALEGGGGAVARDVAEDLEILRVVRHVKHAEDRMLHDEQTTVVPRPVVVLLKRDKNINLSLCDVAFG